MRTLAFAALFALAASASAVERKQLSCEDRGSHNHLETWCEMREQTLPLGGGVLAVDARPNGGITVNGWDRGDILVRAREESAAQTLDDAKALVRSVQVNSTGGQVRAAGPTAEHNRYWSVSYEIFVPRMAAMDLRSTNGGIRVADTMGKVDFQVTNGGVSLMRLGGSVHGHTTNGGLRIVLAGARWEGEGLDVSTTNGGVHLSVPDGYAAHLDVGTTNGGMHLGFPLTVQGRLSHALSTDLGGGGATVRAITTNGGVHIDRGDS